jgi:integrase
VESMLLDVAGHRRSPATMPGYPRGRPPRNKGEQYPADPPTVEEIVAVMRTIGDRAEGHRLRAPIVLLWRAGLRISEALALQESDLDRSRGAVLIRRGKGDICRIRHMPPYVASRTMLRAVLSGRLLLGFRLGRRDIFRAGQRLSRNASSGSGAR